MRNPRAVIARLCMAGLLAAAVPLGLAACTSECAPAVRDGWIRVAPPGMPMQAGFGRIANPCSGAVVVTGASSPAFGDVSLHETRDEGGISRMRAVAELEVPGGGEAVLAPGGLHLMLADPVAPLGEGDRVEIVFALRDGGTVRGAFEVRR